MIIYDHLIADNLPKFAKRLQNKCAYTHTHTHSHTNTHIHTHVHKHTQCRAFTGPAAPRNFTLETIPSSPMQLRAFWVVPDPTNGMIINYTIRCNSSNTQPSLMRMVESSMTSLVLEGLSPFTAYSCRVSATTGAGEGPSSNSMTAQTDEDG